MARTSAPPPGESLPSGSGIDSIFAAIEALTPAQRRKLQKRLHTTGIFVAEDLLSDQNRLRVATAVRDPDHPGVVKLRQSTIFEIPPAPPDADPKPAAPVAPAVPLPSTPRAPSLVPAKPPINPPAAKPPGRVVLGAPHSAELTAHEMAPVPGQAPEGPIAIIFDGGSKGNPGEGYGSYQLRWPGVQPQLVRLQFGSNYTNNEAEYDTLIRALEDVHKRLQQSGADFKSARIEVSGDSQLVIRQVLGEWKCKDPRMAQRRDRVRQLLTPLGSWSIHWHDRSNSVRALGH